MHACVGIDVGRQRVDARGRALVNLRDDEVVHREHKREDEAADYAGRNHREEHLDKRLEGVRSEVERRFVHVGVHTFELGQDAQHDVRRAERDVRDDKTEISFGEGEGHEEYHQRNRHNYFAVDDGELVYVLHHAARLSAHREYAYRREGAHHRRDDGRHRRDEESVSHGVPQRGGLVGSEYRDVRLEREPFVEPEIGTVGEGVHYDEENGRVEQREYDEKISLFEEALDFYHNDLPTLTLPYLPARLMMKLEMRTNTSITRLIMEPTP